MSLTALLRDIIGAEGPMPLSRFMALALGHPRFGYYTTRDPLGAGGDFTTAPEISQLFGEICGLWAISRWQALGSPQHVALVELGPGRGTLMADALRLIGQAAPALRAGLAVHLVETSPALRQRQGDLLAGASAAWHDDLATLPDLPMLVFANEFLDALPIDQFVFDGERWAERRIGLQDDRLAFGLAPAPPGFTGPAGAVAGTLIEITHAADRIMTSLAARLRRRGGAALIIDYGMIEDLPGDTLQAMKDHAFTDPLAEPGTADLTSHIRFEPLARRFAEAGLTVDFLCGQADFLEGFGIRALAGRHRMRATAEQAAMLDTGLARLTERTPQGMGDLFKVLSVSSAATAPAFETSGRRAISRA